MFSLIIELMPLQMAFDSYLLLEKLVKAHQFSVMKYLISSLYDRMPAKTIGALGALRCQNLYILDILYCNVFPKIAAHNLWEHL